MNECREEWKGVSAKAKGPRSWLEQDELSDFSFLAPKGILRDLSVSGTPKISLRPKNYAVGKRLAILPIGLLLVRVEGRPWNRYAEITLLSVAKAFRNRGVAREMISECVIDLKRAGVKTISISYPKGIESEAAMRQLTDQSKGWKQGITTSLYSTGRERAVAFVDRFETIVRELERRNKLKIESYSAVKTGAIRKATKEIRPPAWAKPPQGSSEANYGTWGNFDPGTSLVLKSEERIIGWTLCHKIGEDCHRITVAYVAKEWQRKGAAMVAIVRSVEAILERNPVKSEAEDFSIRFGVFSSNKDMESFTRRRIEEFMSTHHVSQEATISDYRYYSAQAVRQASNTKEEEISGKIRLSSGVQPEGAAQQDTK